MRAADSLLTQYTVHTPHNNKENNTKPKKGRKKSYCSVSMITLTDFPFAVIEIPSIHENFTVQNILSKRLSVQSSYNTSAYISSLEEYLNYIFTQVAYLDPKHDYQCVLKISEGLNLLENNSIPWNLCSIKKLTETTTWTLRDEIVTVIINITLSYGIRSSEIVLSALSMPLHTPDSEVQKLWLSSFKLLKQSIEYINFLKLAKIDCLSNNVFETSSSFIQFVESLIQCSIQFTFLSKAVWTLRSDEYDINLNGTLNYSTLSRISIYVKDELNLMINRLKSSGFQPKLNNWITTLESISKFNSAYFSTFLSIENYKQNKLGISLGFLNYTINNIATKNSNGDDVTGDSNKLKSKLSKLKTKISSNNSIKTKKIKINKSIYESLQNQATQRSLDYLFELVEVLNLKYTIENNNLTFESILDSQTLLQSHLPTGRSVPLTDGSKAWAPQCVSRASEEPERRGQYY